jgi:hypothetical protein
MSAASTYTTTFTETNARHLASKVAADLLQLARLYGQPSEKRIDDFIEELAILLPGGFVASVDYGFQVNGNWLIVLRYTVRSDGTLTADDRAGRVPVSIDVSGAGFASFLRFSEKWSRLSPQDRERIEKSLPFRRATSDEPGIVSGIWVEDKVYSSAGVALTRKVFTPQ